MSEQKEATAPFYKSREIIHIAIEIITVIGISVFFSKKIKTLNNKIDILSSKLEEQQVILNKHEQYIGQLAATNEKLFSYIQNKEDTQNKEDIQDTRNKEKFKRNLEKKKKQPRDIKTEFQQIFPPGILNFVFDETLPKNLGKVIEIDDTYDSPDSLDSKRKNQKNIPVETSDIRDIPDIPDIPDTADASDNDEEESEIELDDIDEELEEELRELNQ